MISLVVVTWSVGPLIWYFISKRSLCSKRSAVLVYSMLCVLYIVQYKLAKTTVNDELNNNSAFIYSFIYSKNGWYNISSSFFSAERVPICPCIAAVYAQQRFSQLRVDKQRKIETTELHIVRGLVLPPGRSVWVYAALSNERAVCCWVTLSIHLFASSFHVRTANTTYPQTGSTLHTGWSDVTLSMVKIRSPFCGYI